MAVAREPGYYNPDNPFDTGRPNEAQGEYRGMDIGPYERRMDEPGVTPWGPGGKAGAPGAVAAPGGGGGAASAGPRSPAWKPPALTDALLGEQSTELESLDGGDPSQSLAKLLQALLGGIPQGGYRGHRAM
jgi:hypothetical protein